MLESQTREFSSALESLDIDFPGVVYNPLDYAWENHCEYLSRYVNPSKVLFLGMNPGPFGMVQTGVPFGAIPMVRDYLGISNPVRHPEIEHPGRPILGFSCSRIEVSGLRFWSLVQSHFPNPDDFFKDFCVMNYLPLAFLDNGRTARNITPDKLPVTFQRSLYRLCDQYLSEVITKLGCTTLVGIGQFARDKLSSIAPAGCKVGWILHPSPASPAANRGWADQAEFQLHNLGIDL